MQGSSHDHDIGLIKLKASKGMPMTYKKGSITNLICLPKKRDDNKTIELDVDNVQAFVSGVQRTDTNMYGKFRIGSMLVNRLEESNIYELQQPKPNRALTCQVTIDKSLATVVRICDLQSLFTLFVYIYMLSLLC